MQLRDKRILLTGASGGIGAALAHEFAVRGARLGLAGRDEELLRRLAERLTEQGGVASVLVADLTDEEDRKRVIESMGRTHGGIDVLVNNAGLGAFEDFLAHDPSDLDRLLALNIAAPMHLTRALLPQMLTRGSGRVVNVGSVFGSIGFACFAAYSASKFALRGFSEALRRELDGSGVGVTYVAPRAVRTPFNSEQVYAMAEQVGMHMDDPEYVARRIAEAVETDRSEVYLGFPESLFVRINALLPRLVDRALRKQNRRMQEFTHARRV